MTEQTPHETAEAIRARLATLRHRPWRLEYIDSGMCNGVSIGAKVLPCEPFTGPPIAEVGSKAAYAEFIAQAPEDVEYLLAHLADLSARLRAREDEIQELKDTLARRDEHTQSERQPAAPADKALPV